MTTKVALITGAQRGLGKATALKLASQGVGIIITYRSNPEEATAVVHEIEQAGGTAAALVLDVNKVESFADFAQTLRETLKEKWSKDTLDILVNNAGNGIAAPFEETTVEQFDSLFNTHIRGVFFLTQALVPVMADGGAILNLSSGLTRFVGIGQTAYASAKGAVEVFTRYLAKELGGRGIRVNTVAPGATGTGFGGGFLRDNEQVRSQLASVTALGRVGEPEDISGAIAAILSDETRWITAQRIEVSGGMNL